MKGAKEYADVLKIGDNIQEGSLTIVFGSHARGYTLQMSVLPDGEDAKWNGCGNSPINKGSVEVYGRISGQPGWTEAYGWLHDGPWVGDFNGIIEQKRNELAIENSKNNLAREKAMEAQHAADAEVLSSYNSK